MWNGGSDNNWGRGQTILTVVALAVCMALL